MDHLITLEIHSDNLSLKNYVYMQTFRICLFALWDNVFKERKWSTSGLVQKLTQHQLQNL